MLKYASAHVWPKGLKQFKGQISFLLLTTTTSLLYYSFKFGHACIVVVGCQRQSVTDHLNQVSLDNYLSLRRIILQGLDLALSR